MLAELSICLNTFILIIKSKNLHPILFHFLKLVLVTYTAVTNYYTFSLYMIDPLKTEKLYKVFPPLKLWIL